ncbi:MAG: VOC family protein [Chloroflexi bacterium]|nr:VOC family protein [Chloroflexota bacterium]
MSVPKPVQLGHIGQIAQPVTDLDRAVAFYRDQLGLRFLFQVARLAFFDCAGTRLMLSLPEADGAQPHGTALYFTVPEIQAAYAGLRDAGVPFVDAPHVVARLGANDLWMAFFTDPDGNVLALMSEAPAA